MTDIYAEIARRLDLPVRGVKATVELLDEGATVPFISRYRKERTGSLDEVAVRGIETTLKAVRDLEARKETVLQAAEAAGKLTPELRRRLEEAETMTAVEDIYAPFKPRKRTRATVAREKGLEPLADMIMSGKAPDCYGAAKRFVDKKGVADVEEALAGASDIIAERASESTRLRNITRKAYDYSGTIVAEAARGKSAELASSPFAQYGGFSHRVRHLPSHQYLALRRAEKEGMLKVRYQLNDSSDRLVNDLCRAFIPQGVSRQCRELIADAVADASGRLLRPSVESELSASLKEDADRVAIGIFSENLRQLLLAAPLKGRRVLALDPGYRTGCKAVAIDEHGTSLYDTVVYPTAPRQDTEGARRILSGMIERYRLDAIALGNGTASRETERFLRGASLLPGNAIYVVNENGASVYSASDLARKEFPDKDVTVRGAVSIGRRLIDPLAELVKIDPKSIGVGQYQHDVDQTGLKNALDYTVMSCVNAVGVDVNTASERLLSYVSGIGPVLAANIVAYRTANGAFNSRRDLKRVPRLGDKAFELCAGFLRVPGGKEPLDNTGIHPESYAIVTEIARRLGVKTSDLPANRELLDSIDIHAMAAAGIGGEATITDIVAELRKPGRDPRVDNDGETFVPDVDSFEQLVPGMVVSGLVNNITAFGAFVNLGIKENGLVHISQLSRTRVNAVSDVLKLGQQIKAKVMDVDTDRRRISLSLLL